MANPIEPSFYIRPIATVRSGLQSKFDAPSQPNPNSDAVNRIVLIDDPRLHTALQDLDGFSHIWLISWFHLNNNWKPRVLPPRGPATRRGLFSTRSPHRPNPIGLTSATLIAVEHDSLLVGPLDLVDGTPILDIKPYIAHYDSHAESVAGWVDQIVSSSIPRYEINLADCTAAIQWLKSNGGAGMIERAMEILASDPMPHRTRRIYRMPDGRLRLACGSWRFYYTVEGDRVTLNEIGTAYSLSALLAMAAASHPDQQNQLDFQLWLAGRMPT